MNIFTTHKFKSIAGAAILLTVSLQVYLRWYDLSPLVFVLEALDIVLLFTAATLLDMRRTLIRTLQEYSNKLEKATSRLLNKTSQLEEVNRAKARALRILNHDIRSPIGTIILASDVLLKQAQVYSNEKSRHLAATINKTAYRMTEMITRFLQDKDDASVLPALQIEEIDIREELDLVVSAHQQYASRINVALTIDAQPDIPLI